MFHSVLRCRANVIVAYVHAKNPLTPQRFVHSTVPQQLSSAAAIATAALSNTPTIPIAVNSSRLLHTIIPAVHSDTTARQLQRVAATITGSVRKMTIPTEPATPLHCVHVHVQVVPGMEDAFIEATLQNTRASSNEEGVVRFDLCRDQEHSNEFVLVEVYKNSTIAPAQHKESSHYLLWRDIVAPMMAQERTRKLYTNLFPTSIDGWKYPNNTPLE